MAFYQGTHNPETIYGTSDPDGIWGDAGNDYLYGMDGDDFVTGDIGDDWVYGGNGHDLLMGSDGNDYLFGQGGNDYLGGGLDDDWINGGAGIDEVTYIIHSTGAGVYVDLARGYATGHGYDRIVQVENVQGSYYDDLIIGNNGANRLKGEDGDDVFRVTQGQDHIIGGPGFDTVDFTTTLLGMTINFGGTGTNGLGTYSSASSAFQGQIEGVEKVIGSGYSDTIIGDQFDNVISGGMGALDSIDGGLGTDTLTFEGMVSANIVDLMHATGSAYEGRVAHFWNGSQSGLDQVTGIENLIGGAYADDFRGNASDNRLDGRDGDDLFRASDGVDAIIGGAGIDTMSFEGYNGVTVNMIVAGPGLGTYSLGAAGSGTTEWIENVFGSNGNDSITGNGFDNILVGGAGNDVIDGLWGVDSLYGGTGSDRLIADGDDILTGNSDPYSAVSDLASDIFEVTTGYGPMPSNVIVTDFQIGIDQLDLTAFGFDSNGISLNWTGTGQLVGTDTVLTLTSQQNEVRTITLLGVTGFTAADMIAGSASLIPQATNRVGGFGNGNEPLVSAAAFVIGSADEMPYFEQYFAKDMSPLNNVWHAVDHFAIV